MLNDFKRAVGDQLPRRPLDRGHRLPVPERRRSASWSTTTWRSGSAIKIVDYTGSKQIESTKIDEKLKEENVSIRLDSFVDDALIRRVEGIVKRMMSEKGYTDAR